MLKPLQTNWNYLILIPPNTQSILTNFDGFDHNYGSVCFTTGRCARLTSKKNKKNPGPSKLRSGYRKQMCWYTLIINTVAGTRFGTPVVFAWEDSIWDGSVMLAHDFKNMLKAKFHNQWSFRICYNGSPETFITGTLLSVITTFVNTKVSQLEDLTYPLYPLYHWKQIVLRGQINTQFSQFSVSQNLTNYTE